MDGLRDTFLQLCDPDTGCPLTLNEEDHLTHCQIQLIGGAWLLAIESQELIQGLIARLLRCFDVFENAKHGVLRIPDLDPHHLLVLLNGLPESCVEQLQLRLELVQINAIAMLGFDRGSQRNNFVPMLVQQNWVQVRSADADIRSRDAQARCDIDFSTQAICRQFLIVGIQQVVGLSMRLALLIIFFEFIICVS